MDYFLCIHQLVVNAIEHGNQFAVDRQVIVEVAITDTYLRWAVEDEGAGFNWQNQVKDEGQQGLTERGRDIAMVHWIFDRLKYNRSGNRVNVVKFLGAKG